MALRTHSTMSRERETKKWTWFTMDPALGPWTSASWSTVSHTHAHSRETKPSKSPTTSRGSAIASHVSGQAWPRSSPVQA